MRKPNGQKEFWGKVEKADGCWMWRGRKSKIGYGYFDMNGRSYLAHRVSMLFTHGAVDEATDVLHKCDNPSCVNPEHLSFGTHAENMRDKVERGRQRRGSRCCAAKLTEEQVSIIKAAGRSVPRLVMAKQFGVNRQAISNILCGRKWKHVTVQTSDD
jgi:hypothetical protein